MNKNNTIKTLMLLALIMCGVKVWGQSGEEGRFMFKITPRQFSYNSNRVIIWCEDDYSHDIYISPDEGFSTTYYFYEIPELLHFEAGCGSENIPYIKGGLRENFHFTCSIGLVTLDFRYDVIMDGPSIIKDINFFNYDYSLISSPYACPEMKIGIEIEDHSLGLVPVECKNVGGDWHTLDNWEIWHYHVESNLDKIYIPFSAIEKAGVNPYQGFQFRTRKKFFEGDEYTTSTSTKTFRYLPAFQFPDDKTIIVEPPQCSGGTTTIKIPYEGNTNYTLTTKGPNASSYGVNVETNNPSVRKENGYYVFSGNFDVGQHNLNIEYKEGQGTPCVFETTFTVPSIPDFTISTPTYPQKIGDYEIRTCGGTGQVSFNVSGSRNQTVTVHAGTQTFNNKTLSNSSQIDGITYYSGTVTIDLPEGTHAISASNATGCTSNTQSTINMRQPDVITYTPKQNNPKCQNDKGSIEITGISGGISPNYYKLDTGQLKSFSGTGFVIPDISSGNHTVTISDAYNNQATYPFTINPAPAPVTITTTITAPAIWGANNGTVRITASGGTPPYSYSKDGTNYQSNNVLNGFTSGEKTIYVKDANGCVFDFPVTIPAGRQITVQSGTSTSPTCPGGMDGSCIITIGDLVGTLSVSNLPASCSYTVSGNIIAVNDLESGTYPFTITETYGGYTSPIQASIVISSKQAISIIPTITPVSDKGTASGKISVSVSGGNAGIYRIVLLDEQNNPVEEKTTALNCLFENLSGSSLNNGKPYDIKVYDSKDCENTVTVRVPEPETVLSLTASITAPVLCHNESNAAVSITATGGWGEYQYSTDNASWNATTAFTNLPAGIYSYYVKDKNGGTAVATVTVINPQPLQIAVQNVTAATCYGSSTGSIRFRVSGGTYPYSFVQNVGTVRETVENGDTITTVSALVSGNYTFTLKDSHNCTVEEQVFVPQPTLLQVAISDILQPTCGYANGELTTNGTGGITPYTYTLSKSGETAVLQSKISSNSVSFSNIASGTYRIKVADSNGCEVQSVPVIFNEYANPSIKTVSVENVICFGESNGKIVATAQKGTVDIACFTLTHSTSNETLQNTTGSFENLLAGNYLLYVFDTNSCQSHNAYPVTVNQPEILSINIDAVYNVINKGAADGKILFRVIGGNTGNTKIYLIDNEGIKIDSILAVKGFVKEFSVPAGDYTLQVIDSKDCTFTTNTLQVSEPDDSLQLIVTEVKDALCKSQTGSISVSGRGGWGGYRYKRADGQYTTLSRFENLYPGTYFITVVDKMGATASQNIMIYEPQDSLQAKITIVENPTCGNNGRLSILLSGGTAPYKLFSNGNDTVFVAQPQTVQWTNVQGGALLLHLLDSNGCKFELETLIPETSLLKIEKPGTVSPGENATDGSIIATVSGGINPYTYLWTKIGANTSFSNISAINNLSSGYYELTVTDGGGCSVESSIYLPAPGDITMEIVETGGETALNAHNGYAVLYADMNASNIRIIDPENNYVDYLPATENSRFHISNDTVYLNNLASGKYFVIATGTQGKNAVAEFEIMPYKAFEFGKIEMIPVSAPGKTDGSVKVKISGGAGENTFVWTDGQGNVIASTNDEYGTLLSNLAAGTYTLTVTDKYGNLISTEVEISEPEQTLQIVVLEQQNQTCHSKVDAYIALSAVGGWGDYRFAHYRQSTTSAFKYYNTTVYAVLETGEHYFYVVDKYGNTAELTVTVTEPELLRASVESVENVKCKDDLNGKITFHITGGNAPYYFRETGTGNWTKGNIAGNLAAGEYSFEFTDSLQCSCADMLQVTVTEPDSLLFSAIHVTHTICSEDNGQIYVALQGGTRPYAYEWKDVENKVIGTDSIIYNLKQNTLYRLYVTDDNGCTQYFEQQINASKSPRIVEVETTDVLCYGNSTGAARITGVEAGEPLAPYTFEWSNGATEDFTEGLPAGQHFVTVTDSNDCSTTYYFDIKQPDSLYIRISDYKEPHCYGYSDGYIHTETYGGAGDYAYLWSNGATTPHIDSITQGNYWVQVTDGNGCIFEKQFTLHEPAYQSIDLGEDVLMCPGNTHVIDGGSYVSYRWFTENNESVSTGRYLSVTEEGHYRLEAKTPDGCSAWGDISVVIGNSALQADMLLASQAALSDTLYVFEISNLPLDSLKWKYDTDAFSRIYTDDEYNQSYVLLLKCKKTGIYNIELQAFSGGCYSPAIKQVEVVEIIGEDTDNWNLLKPLIKSLSQYPNPTGGHFTVEIELREAAVVDLKLFDVESGIIVNQRNETGLDTYNLYYSLSGLHAGVYALIVTAGNERRQVKIIIN